MKNAEIAVHLRAIADLLDTDSMTEQQVPTKAEAPVSEPSEKKQITYEDVRGTLSELSGGGHRAEVKAILKKHGVTKLSEISPSDFETVLAEAAEVKNA